MIFMNGQEGIEPVGRYEWQGGIPAMKRGER